MDALLPMLVWKQSFTFNQIWIELVFLACLGVFTIFNRAGLSVLCISKYNNENKLLVYICKVYGPR